MRNGPSWTTLVDRFSDSGNSWTARTAISVARTSNVAIGLTTNLGLNATGQILGHGQDNLVERYSDSGNSWTARTNYSEQVQGGIGLTLGSNFGILAGGYNYFSSYHSILSNKYSNSDNTWTARASTHITTLHTVSIELSTNSGIAPQPSNTVQYYDSENIWATRTGQATGKVGTFSLSSSSGLVAGNGTIRYTGISNNSFDNGLTLETSESSESSSTPRITELTLVLSSFIAILIALFSASSSSPKSLIISIACFTGSVLASFFRLKNSPEKLTVSCFNGFKPWKFE